MRPPAIRRSHVLRGQCHRERGFTMVLVAVAMVAILAMAALSIDVVALYLAREEAQRSADAAALAAARVLSLSGVTGDPSNVQGGLPGPPWPAACSAATQVAQAVANENAVGSTVPNTVNVTYLYNGATTDCTSITGGFAINPQVQVKVIRQGLPTLFSRIWSRSTNSVSATATAEAFNPSNSGSIAPNGIVLPVNPRCVKPWIVPNSDPGNAAATFVSLADGSITTPGIKLSGVGTGVIGESFNLVPDCKPGGGPCSNPGLGNPLPNNPPVANPATGQLQFVPGQLPASVTAVPSCSGGSSLEETITGCDQATVYQCGTQLQNTVDLGVMNVSSDTTSAGQCITHYQSATTDQDFLDTSTFPYKIISGTNNPLSGAGISAGTPITDSNSIVTIPIYDQTPAGGLNATGTTAVTIVGFLQVFINNEDPVTGVSVTVLNVSGCGNGLTTVVSSTAVTGSSPVPVRLITPQ